MAAEAGGRGWRGGLAHRQRGARAAQGEGGAARYRRSVLRGEDDRLAALLLEEGGGGDLQNEFGALNALVLVTLRGRSQTGEGGDGNWGL